jgi:hypothetical protein
LLTQTLAATTTAAGAGDGGSGLDPRTVLGIPAAVAAVLTILSYVVGFIRPVSVKKPRYWHAGQEATRFSCVVRNRSLFGDKSIAGVTLVRAPGWWKRTFWPFWKRHPQNADLLPWSVTPNPLPTLSKRNEITIAGELRKATDPDNSGIYDPDGHSGLLAHVGSRSSRWKRLKKFAPS